MGATVYARGLPPTPRVTCRLVFLKCVARFYLQPLFCHPHPRLYYTTPTSLCEADSRHWLLRDSTNSLSKLSFRVIARSISCADPESGANFQGYVRCLFSTSILLASRISVIGSSGSTSSASQYIVDLASSPPSLTAIAVENQPRIYNEHRFQATPQHGPCRLRRSPTSWAGASQTVHWRWGRRQHIRQVTGCSVNSTSLTRTADGEAASTRDITRVVL